MLHVRSYLDAQCDSFNHPAAIAPPYLGGLQILVNPYLSINKKWLLMSVVISKFWRLAAITSAKVCSEKKLHFKKLLKCLNNILLRRQVDTLEMVRGWTILKGKIVKFNHLLRKYV
jgi:hypothetical protein